jgi:hypothetical protein
MTATAEKISNGRNVVAFSSIARFVKSATDSTAANEEYLIS